MVSVGTQLKHNRRVQGRVDAAAPEHGHLVDQYAIAILVAARDSRIYGDNRAPALKRGLSMQL